ncbi:hypothetical protein PTI98_003491 [Pleurotus ostreatus]|nr:hypothetical protein PTI98_003491 [Pleurotus ostreatus]
MRIKYFLQIESVIPDAKYNMFFNISGGSTLVRLQAAGCIALFPQEVYLGEMSMELLVEDFFEFSCLLLVRVSIAWSRQPY